MLEKTKGAQLQEGGGVELLALHRTSPRREGEKGIQTDWRVWLDALGVWGGRFGQTDREKSSHAKGEG